jgi:hypothetical protein
MFTMSVTGIMRAQVPTFNSLSIASGSSYDTSFYLCSVPQEIGASVKLSSSPDCVTDLVYFSNPAIDISEPTLAETQVAMASEATLVPIIAAPGAYILTSFSFDCEEKKLLQYDGIYYVHDSRTEILENTISSPTIATGNGYNACPAATKNPFNALGCIREPSCVAPAFSSVFFELNATTLQYWYDANGYYVYKIDGLRLEYPYDISPCAANSRWVPLGADCSSFGGETSGIDTTSMNALKSALLASLDPNPYMRDIVTPTGCEAGVEAIAAKLQAGSTCWQHVHPNLYNVHDMNIFALYHDGNALANAEGRANPITKHLALFNTITFPYPSWHDMQRWYDKESETNSQIRKVGRFGDVVNFATLPVDLQTREMAAYVGAIESITDSGFESCGTVGEVANEPLYGHHYFGSPNSEYIWNAARKLDQPHDIHSSHVMAWSSTVFNAPDQLRHRVAFALYHMFNGVNTDRNHAAEEQTVYYDIFVRNAFGNYRNLLKEIVYSPMTAQFLTYRGSSAYAYAGKYPDENFAREVMQLFTIGLWKLHSNGTYVFNDRQHVRNSNRRVPTYNNDDILTFAGVWTGYNVQAKRANVAWDGNRESDPLKMYSLQHDRKPKAKLDEGYLGDRLPLCSKLPDKHFLLAGATYVYTGDASAEGSVIDDYAVTRSWARDQFQPYKTSNFESPLFAALCARDPVSGRCTFPSTLTLREDIDCFGKECDPDTLWVVKIVDANTGQSGYFKYIRPSCVRLTFPTEGKLTEFPNKDDPNRNGLDYFQCEDRNDAVATITCCQNGVQTPAYDFETYGPSDFDECRFLFEQTTFDTARARCQQKGVGWDLCTNHEVGYNSWGWKRTCGGPTFTWVNQSCAMQVELCCKSPCIHPFDYEAFRTFAAGAGAGQRLDQHRRPRRAVDLAGRPRHRRHLQHSQPTEQPRHLSCPLGQ